MDDSLTELVLEYQNGNETIDVVRNRILMEAFHHLSRYRRKNEDEVSEFLLQFHGKIEGLIGRFQSRGLPFRHFLLRTLRWQWTTFRAELAQQRRQAWVLAEAGVGAHDDEINEPGWGDEASTRWPALSHTTRKRLLLLALKASPDLNDNHLESLSHQTGVDLAQLQGYQHRLRAVTGRRRHRSQALAEKRSEAFYRRLAAEDEAQRETDPERRQRHEHRAGLYRRRLANLTLQQRSVSMAPTHRELANLLGMPKGSVDSGLHHLKKELACVYSGGHDDPVGDE